MSDPHLGALRAALWSSAGLLCLGFGAMAAFSLFTTHPAGVPNLWVYKSATYGDGICLPLAAFGLTYGCHGLGKTRTNVRISLVGCMLGISAGALTQIQWLEDAHPRLNWTLPSPGHFNIPGWYHAVFLTFACGLFGGFLTCLAQLILRIDLPRQDNRRVSIATSISVVSLVAFGILLASDNAAATGTAAGKATEIATIAAVAVAVTAGAIIALVRLLRRRVV